MPTPTLYTQNGCAESDLTRAWLAERGIDFIERNVSGDYDAALALAATGTFATPLLVLDGETVLGFRPGEFAAILHLAQDS